MIIYFADRLLNILGQASTHLPEGLTIDSDLKTEEVETGVATFECKIPYNAETRKMVEECAKVGNYILRHNGEENEFFTIMESEGDSKNQEVYIYAEDAGLDLLNEVVGAYAADKAYPIEHYVLLFANDSGFEIGINEVSNLTRKLRWDGETTAVERIASVATQFDGCEISYSFEVEGLSVVKKYINIYKERGKDLGIQLRLNYDIDRIVTTKSIANLATALQCTGGTPDSEDGEEVDPITLDGYVYDDGDFYVENGVLKSRVALQNWSRFIQNGKVSTNKGHIVRQYSYDTLSQETLCKRAITELKKAREVEINYEIDIKKLPDNVKIGDRVNIVDEAGELYVSSRILMLKTSIADDEQTATLGEHLLKSSGISQQVTELASALNANARAKAIADAAKAKADIANGTADEALSESENAQATAEAAKTTADSATATAEEAQAAANEAQAAVSEVQENVADIEERVGNAEDAVEQAHQAAETAETNATEAKELALKATEDATKAKEASETATTTANEAKESATQAKTTAQTAISQAEEAATTAQAAKLDAENAQKDIDALSENLTTLESTMKADYARKTELTEATASLQSQITQNAGQIQSTVTKVQEIDETANNAAEQAAQAQATAATAQEQADKATEDAQKAQNAADVANQAAIDAQAEADKAKAAADTAQSVADKAEADLATAKADLATVSSRVDATEEDILVAQEAVDVAQAAADTAKADATDAVAKANNAQSVADEAAINATNAQSVANEASEQASLAQQVANEAKGNAETAIAKAEEAKTTATNAQTVANEAKTNATNAQTIANQAVADAEAAQNAADEADAKAQAAQADLDTAKANLATVSAKADATAEEVEVAQAAVEVAQNAADQAQADAEAAQATADTAKANAQTAQNAADEAQEAADKAQADADKAQDAADKAQAEVDALEIRVTSAETQILQTSEQIKLLATKEEVTTTLGGYYTKDETDAAISLTSEQIQLNVSQTYTTKDDFEALEIGGRNLYIKKNAVDGYLASDGSGNITPSGTVTKEKTSDFIAVNVGEKIQFQVWVTTPSDSYVWYGYQFFNADKTIFDTNRPATHMYEMAGGHYHAVCMYPIVVPEGASYLRVSARMFDDGEIKVEKGTKPTDWTPAPEDLATTEEMENAVSGINDTNERVTVAESLIQQLSDCISMLITDGNGTSLMEQTENGWTFSMAQMNSAMSSLSNSLQDLLNETDDTKAIVSVLESAVADLEETAEYVRIKTYEDEPCIELGESDSNFKLMITNTRIMFMEGNNTPTYINTNGLVTENLTVNGEIHHGNWVWKQRSNGNYGLQWVG